MKVIAEAGANHNNSIESALNLALEAKKAGAWAIKFQLYKAGKIAIKNSSKYWSDSFGTNSQYDAFKLTDQTHYDDWKTVKDYCDEIGIIFFATPFDEYAVEALEKINIECYKIASGDITNTPLIDTIASTQKKVFLSTGASTLTEIQHAIDCIKRHHNKIVPMACNLCYPTKPENANINQVRILNNCYPEYEIGYSDHTLGTKSAWVLASINCKYIEKHYTLDNTASLSPDHAMSILPKHIAEIKNIAKQVEMLLGHQEWVIDDSEIAARLNARRSIVSTRKILAGETLQRDDIDFKRPGTGISPTEHKNILGKVARTTIHADSIINPENLYD